MSHQFSEKKREKCKKTSPLFALYYSGQAEPTLRLFGESVPTNKAWVQHSNECNSKAVVDVLESVF